MGLDPVDAAGLVREPVQRYVDPRDGLVHERVNPALRGRDNVLSLRVNGEDRFLFFNATDERAARIAQNAARSSSTPTPQAARPAAPAPSAGRRRSVSGAPVPTRPWC